MPKILNIKKALVNYAIVAKFPVFNHRALVPSLQRFNKYVILNSFRIHFKPMKQF